MKPILLCIAVAMFSSLVQAQSAMSLEKASDAPLKTEFIRIQHLNLRPCGSTRGIYYWSQDAVFLLEGLGRLLLSPKSSLEMDVRSNTVTLTETETNLNKLMEATKVLDQPLLATPTEKNCSIPENKRVYYSICEHP